MKYFQYIRIHKIFISQEVLGEYNIIFDDRNFTYVEIRRGVYSLKESGVFAFDQLVRNSNDLATSPCPKPPDSGNIPPAE